MRYRSITATAATLIAGAALAGPALVHADTATPTVVDAAPAATGSAAPLAPTPASAPVEFDVGLQPVDRAGAEALAGAVSDPSSSSYGAYLTPAEWEGRFSPSQSSVQAVSSWLKAQGITVEAVSPDRLTIEARAAAATIEKAFGSALAQYTVEGHSVRLSKEALKVPAALAPLISGISGIDETLAKPEGLSGADTKRTKKATNEISTGFVVAKPCAKYYGQKYDTSIPPYAPGYPEPLPYAVCGYTPPQLQGAYGLSSTIAGGDDGKGEKVAVVDAFLSPTLFSDAHEYSERDQAGQPLESAQFSVVRMKPFEETPECQEEEWAGEQTLDVEAVHATAPGAHIVAVATKTCTLTSLENGVQQIVDEGHVQVVSDSWGNTGGDLLEPEAARKAFDNVLLMADDTGIGVQFSSGDEGDNYAPIGMNVVDYPAASPYSTAVGGTSLEVGKRDERIGEYGWSTGRSVLCTDLLAELEYPGCSEADLETWVPPAPGEYDYGGGGGTSFQYPEPSYQEAVVPAALAERNSSTTKERNRVVPDISMDADPSTGMEVGETQEFPNGLRYNEYRIGGTSLSSPLFAGVMADADQAAGKALGFANPLLYKLDSLPQTAAAAFYDVVPAGKQALARVDYLNSINAREGTLTSVRVIEDEGKQEYCDGTGSCEHERNILSTAPGYDSMTGIGTPASGLIAALAKG